MSNNPIRRVMNDSLSHMEFSDRQKQNVLTKVKGETVVKRKISAGLVFALVLVLAAGIALAVYTLRDTGRQIVETEQTDGYYKDWPIEKKIQLVKALVELDYVEETEAGKQLIAGSLAKEEAHRVADEMLVTFTGDEVSEISFMNIMQAAWGPFSQWTKDEQAWYSQLMVDMNLQGEDHTLYVEPVGSVDEAQAIAIARRAVAKGYGVEESALDAYTVTTSFQVPEFAKPGDDQPYWYVEFSAPGDMPEAQRVFRTFWVFIHPETGELLEEVEDTLAAWAAQEVYLNDPIFKAMRAFDEEHGYPHSRTLEGWASWSETMRPMILQKQKDDPDFFGDDSGSARTLASVAFIYGVPDDAALTEDEALALAERALVEQLGRDEAEIKFFNHKKDVYYDITDPEKPLWKFFFRMPNQYTSDEALGAEIAAFYGDTRPLSYKVEIDAHTGEVVQAFGLEWGDLNTVEEWKQAM